MTEQLPDLKCNVLGFWGMQDAFNPVGGADKLAKGIKNCRVVLVNQCGHWVQVEHREMFNRTCIDFMKNG
jgi:4,5:9,10-diseco-3-hydroxy-5,9,17-trioxoandrosta-1(10),2-diene-4-oate hydrolase